MFRKIAANFGIALALTVAAISASATAAASTESELNTQEATAQGAKTFVRWYQVDPDNPIGAQLRCVSDGRDYHADGHRFECSKNGDRVELYVWF